MMQPDVFYHIMMVAPDRAISARMSLCAMCDVIRGHGRLHDWSVGNGEHNGAHRFQNHDTKPGIAEAEDMTDPSCARTGARHASVAAAWLQRGQRHWAIGSVPRLAESGVFWKQKCRPEATGIEHNVGL